MKNHTIKRNLMTFLLLYFNGTQLIAHSYLQEFKKLLPKTKDQILKKITEETKIFGDGIEKLRKENIRKGKSSLSIYDFDSTQQNVMQELARNYRKKLWDDVNTLALILLAEVFSPEHKESTGEYLDIFCDNEIILPETNMYISKKFKLIDKSGERKDQEIVVLYCQLGHLSFDHIIVTRKKKDDPWVELCGFDSFEGLPLNKSLYPIIDKLDEELVDKQKMLQKLHLLSSNLLQLQYVRKKPEFKLIFDKNPQLLKDLDS